MLYMLAQLIINCITSSTVRNGCAFSFAFFFAMLYTFSNLFPSEIDKNLLTLAGITDILSFQRIEDYLKQLPKDKVRVWNMDNDTYLNLED